MPADPPEFIAPGANLPIPLTTSDGTVVGEVTSIERSPDGSAIIDTDDEGLIRALRAGTVVRIDHPGEPCTFVNGQCAGCGRLDLGLAREDGGTIVLAGSGAIADLWSPRFLPGPAGFAALGLPMPTEFMFAPPAVFEGAARDNARLLPAEPIKVEWRGGATWCVSRGLGRGNAWVWCEADSDWELEPMPSSREDDFQARCRYDLDTALAIGARLAAL